MNTEFSSRLQELRSKSRLTNTELAKLADVPDTLIAGLQTNKRRIGEYQARKIGRALKLSGGELEEFVYSAINTCTEKVLNDVKDYPSQVLNLLALQLRHAGIGAESINECTITGTNVSLNLGSGKTATIKTE